MIQIELTLLNDVKLSTGIIQMVDRETSANTFIFIIEEEELQMLLDELNDLGCIYNYDIQMTRLDAIKKMGKYGAFVALGTMIILNPKTAQAGSPPSGGGGPDNPPSPGFGRRRKRSMFNN